MIFKLILSSKIWVRNTHRMWSDVTRGKDQGNFLEKIFHSLPLQHGCKKATWRYISSNFLMFFYYFFYIIINFYKLNLCSLMFCSSFERLLCEVNLCYKLKILHVDDVKHVFTCYSGYTVYSHFIWSRWNHIFMGTFTEW